MNEVKKGDYVLATKYEDGCSKDHFCIGFFNGMLIDKYGKETERYMIVDSNNKNFRANGFRRIGKISTEIGKILVDNIDIIEQASCSVWYWRYHPNKLKKIAQM